MALYHWISVVVLLVVHLISHSEGLKQDDTYLIHHVNESLINITRHMKPHHGIHVANWRWDEIGVFFTFTIFIVVSGLAKVAFHHASSISAHIPESCLMIIIGVTVGGIFYICGVPPPNKEDNNPQDHLAVPLFTPRLFFLVLLPPVVLEAAYSLYNRAFTYNVCTILLYAVVGTLFNTFTIGPLLFFLSWLGFIGSLPQSLSLTECLVFSSLISAVDPVAVLAIFQEIGVNKDLYYLVFGESLFNDAVTIVLYTTMVTFCEMSSIPVTDYGLAVVAFFTVSVGGICVGAVFGLVSALITKTTKDIRVVEPLAVLGIAYLSYLAAELFHWSGIISIIICGLVQAHYALKNISQKSYTTVKYFIKMLSSTCDSVIFLFLGMVLVNDKHVWHTGFVLWTLLLCLLCRFMGVFLLTAGANKLRVRKINLQEQFIMAYGGLRGAIAFSMVEMLEEDTVPFRNMFVTTTLVVIFFTVFIQGSTIKPLVKLMHIATSNTEKSTMTDELNNNIVDSMMAGIEEISGVRGDFYIRMKLEQIDELFLKKIFLSKSPDNDLTRFYEKLCLTDHYAHLYGPVTLVEESKGLVINNPQNEEERSPLVSSPSTRTTTRFEDLFPGVELRRRTGSVRDSNKPVSTDTLRKALSTHDYQKFHQIYNPNLVDDHCQELRDQLRLRHLKARRIAGAASQLRRQISEIPGDVFLEEFDRPRRQIHSELEGFCSQDQEGIDTILSRTGQRLLRQRSVASNMSPNSPPTEQGKFEWPNSQKKSESNSQKDQQLNNLESCDEELTEVKTHESKL